MQTTSIQSSRTKTEDELTQQYIGLFASAEVLVVVHPNCSGALPAMMKGWMDRVFVEGSAYAFENLRIRAMRGKACWR
jgi:putative NADPH-quinone reductase